MAQFRLDLTNTSLDYYVNRIKYYDLTTHEEEAILNYSGKHYIYLHLLRAVILEKRGLGRVEDVVPFISNFIRDGFFSNINNFKCFPKLEEYCTLSPYREKLLDLLFEEIKKDPFILIDSRYSSTINKNEGISYKSGFERIYEILSARYNFFKEQEKDKVQREILEILKYSPGSAEYLKAKSDFKDRC